MAPSYWRERDLRACAQQQHVEPRLLRQAIRTEFFDQGAVFALVQISLRLVNGNLGTRNAQFFGIRKHALGRRRFAAAQVRLPQQDQRRQHARIFLERVLQLNDRAGVVAALVALQRILVIARRLLGRVGMGERRKQCAGQHDRQQTGQGHFGSTKCHHEHLASFVPGSLPVPACHERVSSRDRRRESDPSVGRPTTRRVWHTLYNACFA